jgi:hypothetical protein
VRRHKVEVEGKQRVKGTTGERKTNGERRAQGHIEAPINLRGHNVVVKLTFVYNYKNVWKVK